MVEPKQIGDFRTTEEKSTAARKLDVKVMVPLKNEIRSVEAFDALPVKGKVTPIVTEENSTLKYLRFSRVALEKDSAEAEIALAEEEALFYLNRGQAQLTVEGKTYSLQKGDVLYVGIHQKVKISTADFCDISVFKAIDCHTAYPVQLVRHQDIIGTPLAADLGNKRPMTRRTVFKLVDHNVQACRLLFGDTYVTQAGAVGSYPPHFHGPDGPHGLGKNAKEELYHFRCVSEIEGDVPFVLQNCALPEEKVGVYFHVFDEMAVNVTPSYHDTMAPPSVHFMFTWCLASFTEGHREWAEIYNKPGFEGEW
jgi:4-deoxy-L-threo-5-hexosulose-uronate ketol-isomerase